MTTPVQQKIRNKTISAEKMAGLVKSGDWFTMGSAVGDSTACAEAIAKRLGPGQGDLKDIEIWLYASAFPQRWWQEADPGQKYHCINEYFFFPWNRKARDENGVTNWAHWGWAIGMWYHHYRFYNAVKEKRGIDWYITATSPPDKRGYFNLSYATNNGYIYNLNQWHALCVLVHAAKIGLYPSIFDPHTGKLPAIWGTAERSTS
jgi:acyl-CoA hydrolase